MSDSLVSVIQITEAYENFLPPPQIKIETFSKSPGTFPRNVQQFLSASGNFGVSEAPGPIIPGSSKFHPTPNCESNYPMWHQNLQMVKVYSSCFLNFSEGFDLKFANVAFCFVVFFQTEIHRFEIWSDFFRIWISSMVFSEKKRMSTYPLAV